MYTFLLFICLMSVLRPSQRHKRVEENFSSSIEEICLWIIYDFILLSYLQESEWGITWWKVYSFILQSSKLKWFIIRKKFEPGKNWKLLLFTLESSLQLTAIDLHIPWNLKTIQNVIFCNICTASLILKPCKLFMPW